jgi:hypothetical protein
MKSNNEKQYGAIALHGTDETASPAPDKPINGNRLTYRLWGIGALFIVAFLALFHAGTSSGGGVLGTTGAASSVPILSSALSPVSSSSPDPDEPLFFNQIVDHFDTGSEYEDMTWSHRYYQSTEYYGGPGHPIFVIVGGEGALDFGMLYPFVTQVLAKQFQAAVLQIEHRFYGPYHPILNATIPQLQDLLTPRQAMADMVHLVEHKRDHEFHCSADKASLQYCPMITVGASYPGFLSALFRLVYPDFVDISYASSAPLLMYGQAVDTNVYYDIVTAAAERSSPGCAHSVRKTLDDTVRRVNDASSLEQAAKELGVCPDSIPIYITTKEMFRDAIVMITSFSFAELNAANYPPGPDTGLVKICQLFQNPAINELETLQSFFHSMMEQEEEEEKGCSFPNVDCDDDNTVELVDTCFDMMTQIPNRNDPNSTLMDTPGDYDDGYMWDFQTCTLVIFILGFSEESMFPPHTATYDALANHCQKRFGVTPRPHQLEDEWGLDDLSSNNASYILFTNGLQDMWSGGSYVEDVSDTVIAMNFENGAHHSDLSHEGPTDKDTEDIVQGFSDIADTLEAWLGQLEEEWKKP